MYSATWQTNKVAIKIATCKTNSFTLHTKYLHKQMSPNQPSKQHTDIHEMQFETPHLHLHDKQIPLRLNDETRQRNHKKPWAKSHITLTFFSLVSSRGMGQTESDRWRRMRKLSLAQYFIPHNNVVGNNARTTMIVCVVGTGANQPGSAQQHIWSILNIVTGMEWLLLLLVMWSRIGAASDAAGSIYIRSY